MCRSAWAQFLSVFFLESFCEEQSTGCGWEADMRGKKGKKVSQKETLFGI
jgi:hypothetical protein